MFDWYSRARCCYVHLEDYEIGDEDEDDDLFDQLGYCRWFTRGWTLQELIAPTSLRFYSRTWRYISSGNTEDATTGIERITGVDKELLGKRTSLGAYSIATKMSWASGRETTRIEDRAYCLLGLFGVNMPLIYGEGKMAFVRLQEELFRRDPDQSILLWDASQGKLLIGAVPYNVALPVDNDEAKRIPPCWRQPTPVTVVAQGRVGGAFAEDPNGFGVSKSLLRALVMKKRWNGRPGRLLKPLYLDPDAITSHGLVTTVRLVETTSSLLWFGVLLGQDTEGTGSWEYWIPLLRTETLNSFTRVEYPVSAAEMPAEHGFHQILEKIKPTTIYISLRQVMGRMWNVVPSPYDSLCVVPWGKLDRGKSIARRSEILLAFPTGRREHTYLPTPLPMKVEWGEDSGSESSSDSDDTVSTTPGEALDGSSGPQGPSAVRKRSCYLFYQCVTFSPAKAGQREVCVLFAALVQPATLRFRQYMTCRIMVSDDAECFDEWADMMMQEVALQLRAGNMHPSMWQKSDSMEGHSVTLGNDVHEVSEGIIHTSHELTQRSLSGIGKCVLEYFVAAVNFPLEADSTVSHSAEPRETLASVS
jgi:hypothetical protein